MARTELIETTSVRQIADRRVRWMAITLVAALLVLSVTHAMAAHPYERWAEEFGIDLDVSYDGTRILELEGGQFEATEHRAPGKMYTEVHMGGMQSGIILREDLQKSYILMPSMGFYKEDSLEDGLLQTSNGMEFSDIEEVGREPVIGHPSTKFKYKFKDNEGKGAGFMWVTDTGVPIKIDTIYSNKDAKNTRISMVFTELNFREQDPAIFEVPAELEPLGIASIGTILKQAASAASTATGTKSPYDTDDEELAARQQACLEEAAKQAAEQKEAQKKKRTFGRLVGAMSRTAARLGVGGNVGKNSREIYDANATAHDASVMAEELGITEEDVERCRDPQ